MGGLGSKHRGGGGDGSGGRKSALAMLDNSHRKLEQNLAELRRAAVAIAGGTGTEAEHDTVRDVVGFLERSVTRHEADEELSLFPRLRGAGSIDPVLDTLADEHLEHRRLHRRLHEIVEAWLDAPATDDHNQHLLRVVIELEDAYRRHIELEEREMFPAARALPADQLAEIEDEMQARRGR